MKTAFVTMFLSRRGRYLIIIAIVLLQIAGLIVGAKDWRQMAAFTEIAHGIALLAFALYLIFANGHLMERLIWGTLLIAYLLFLGYVWWDLYHGH